MPRNVVAVARKLSVLLHKLWVSSEDYEPLHNHSTVQWRRTELELSSGTAEFG